MVRLRLESSPGLCFGCVPDVADDASREQVAEVARALSKQLGQSVDAAVAPTPAELASWFQAGKVTLAWTSPTLMLTSRGLGDALPLVSSVRQGLAAYHSIVYTRADSKYKSPADLQGARAAWVAPTSAGGCIFPRLALASYGFDPRHVFASEQYYGTHGGVARAVLDGEADVGGGYAVFHDGDVTRELVRAPFLSDGGLGAARVLLVTSAIPADLIVASKAVPEGTRDALATALCALDAKSPALNAFSAVLGVDGFRPFNAEMVKPLREQVACGVELGLIDLA
jgi:phosphonate transport system substrate-binding protein